MKAIVAWICLFAIQSSSTQRAGLELLSTGEIVRTLVFPRKYLKYFHLETTAVVAGRTVTNFRGTGAVEQPECALT
jgi:hypothetical protein